jgi:hypothetical protein
MTAIFKSFPYFSLVLTTHSDCAITPSFFKYYFPTEAIASSIIFNTSFG